MRAFTGQHVDHACLCMDLTEYTARFGRNVVRRADAFASRELTAPVRYILHARKLVLFAHDSAPLPWKVPSWLPTATALVSTLVLIYDASHLAGLVSLAKQRAHLT